MSTNDDDPSRPLLRKLSRLNSLGSADEAALRALPFSTSSVKAGQFLVREGDTPDTCSLLLTGYACRHKETSAGGRQIVSFHMSGDTVDLQHLFIRTADHNVETITEARIATVPIKPLRDLAQKRPNIGEALWRDTLVDASIFREWVLNVGRRSAKSRIAHMLCEFALRREAAGLGPPERFDFPMTQSQIGDATGLTSVHVNRMLQELGDEGVIARSKREVEIIDWRRMRQIADFDQAYLHAAA